MIEGFHFLSLLKIDKRVNVAVCNFLFVCLFVASFLPSVFLCFAFVSLAVKLTFLWSCSAVQVRVPPVVVCHLWKNLFIGIF